MIPNFISSRAGQRVRKPAWNSALLGLKQAEFWAFDRRASPSIVEDPNGWIIDTAEHCYQIILKPIFEYFKKTKEVLMIFGQSGIDNWR